MPPEMTTLLQSWGPLAVVAWVLWRKYESLEKRYLDQEKYIRETLSGLVTQAIAEMRACRQSRSCPEPHDASNCEKSPIEKKCKNDGDSDLVRLENTLLPKDTI